MEFIMFFIVFLLIFTLAGGTSRVVKLWVRRDKRIIANLPPLGVQRVAKNRANAVRLLSLIALLCLSFILIGTFGIFSIVPLAVIWTGAIREALNYQESVHDEIDKRTQVIKNTPIYRRCRSCSACILDESDIYCRVCGKSLAPPVLEDEARHGIGF